MKLLKMHSEGQAQTDRIRDASKPREQLGGGRGGKHGNIFRVSRDHGEVSGANPKSCIHVLATTSSSTLRPKRHHFFLHEYQCTTDPSPFMTIPRSPFSSTSESVPGKGILGLALLHPGAQVCQQLTYQYPLKLIAPDPHKSLDDKQRPVSVVFILTYGGGLVGGDQITLRAHLLSDTRLIFLTQGSTKIFKSSSREVVSRQNLHVTLETGAALCYLPDPTQPFADSVYDQRQTFYLNPRSRSSSLCMLDWVSQGREARGEKWDLHSWKGKIEVREPVPKGENHPGRLLLRDAVMLSGKGAQRRQHGTLSATDNLGVFGTLIVHGPLFEQIGSFIMDEFSHQPRIGGKSWPRQEHEKEAEEDAATASRNQRHRQEEADGLLWTVANIRGFVVVKFGAHDVTGAKRWLRTLLRHDGIIEKAFGHQAFFCLR